MKTSLYKIFMFIASGLLLVSGLAIAQPVQKADEKPPIAQPLVREGDFAVKLTAALKLGTVTNETEAESLLGSAGIVPRNGWIADYPVTPDIIAELQTAIAEAAIAGKLAMGKDEALKAAEEVTSGFDLSIKTDAPVQRGSSLPGTNAPETHIINNYYYNEGPPVVTYYSPPPDYAYMYTWVPYPFWWWNYWYPGYFVLVNFHVRAHYHGGHGVFVSNHYHDSRTGRLYRIDPANRSRGGTLPVRERPGLSSPSARRGAQAIVQSSQGRASTGPNRAFRGYEERPSSGTRPSAYEHSRNSRFERAASDRGVQSRSTAGRVTDGGRGGQGVSRSVPRGDNKTGTDDDAGRFRGGGRR